MENKYKNENNSSVGSALTQSAEGGVSIPPPAYNNRDNKEKEGDKEEKTGFEVIDYSSLVTKQKSPLDIKRSRIPQVAYGKQQNLMVTFIDTNQEGEKEEETVFLESWGHKENVYRDGVLIVECNEKTGVYKETISFNDNMFISSGKQMYNEGLGKLVVVDAKGETKTYDFSVLKIEEKKEALNLLNQKGIDIYYSDFKKASINEVWEYEVNGDGTFFGESRIKTDVINKYDSEDEYTNWKDNPKEEYKTNWLYSIVKGAAEKDRSLDGDNNEHAMAEGLLLGLEGILTLSSLGASTAAIGAAKSWAGKLLAGAILTWEINDLTGLGGETIIERVSKEISTEYGEMGFNALNGVVELYGDTKSIYKIITWDGKGNKYKLLWDTKSGIKNGSLILMGTNPYVKESRDDNKE